MKVNLLRSFGSESAVSSMYDDTWAGERQRTWRNMLLGLSVFNAVVHERKKYGTLGWNVDYEFIDADLEVYKSCIVSVYVIASVALWYTNK